MSEAIHEQNYIYDFHYHLVWCTKYRHSIFTTDELVNDMKEILSYVAGLNDITIEQMEVMPDHIHLLLSFKPKIAPTNVVKALKGGSARLFFARHHDIKDDSFWGSGLWSHSYYMSTLGNMSKDVVDAYIRNQYKTK